MPTPEALIEKLKQMKADAEAEGDTHKAAQLQQRIESLEQMGAAGGCGE